MKELVCKYCKDEFCVNDQCPMCADYCPVPDMPGVCKHEERVEVKIKVSKLTPRECLHNALGDPDIDTFVIYKAFETLLAENGWKITEHHKENNNSKGIAEKWVPGQIVTRNDISCSEDWAYHHRENDEHGRECVVCVTRDKLLSVSFVSGEECGAVMLNRSKDEKPKYFLGQELSVEDVANSDYWNLKSFASNPFDTTCTYINKNNTMIVVFEHGKDHGIVREYDKFEVGKRVHIGAIGESPRWMYVGEENDVVRYVTRDNKLYIAFVNGSDWGTVMLNQ